ncbi:hypothetical protein GCM10011415_12680 [Salipiger pallidus]|uniref:Uncharacterized protein n=1 Tax=Salipiger pallidus TaxID=1775170 RepID=A0A8J2ZIC8_9RHOB|nr:hypothetical protein [Salipiger pallidus]GGG67231.1 hypothetical protein GCM10011415_12680 [Salipiger pallidus]
MSARFIAIVLAVSVTITGFAAAPAKADDTDIAHALGTSVAAAIIGQKLRDHDGGLAGVRRVDSVPRVVDPRRDYDKRRELSLVLPRHCVVELRGGRERFAVSNRCLKQVNWRGARLPDRCEFKIRNGKYEEKALSLRCLQSEGFRIGNRRHPGWGRNFDPRWQDGRGNFGQGNFGRGNRGDGTFGQGWGHRGNGGTFWRRD